MSRLTRTKEMLSDAYPAFTDKIVRTFNKFEPEVADRQMVDALIKAYPDFIAEIVGPTVSTKELTEASRSAIVSHVEAFQTYLDGLNDLRDEEFLEAYRRHFEGKRNAQAGSRISDLERYAAFHHPRADARFSYWISLPTWSLEEGAALLLGKDPSEVNIQKLALTAHQSPFVERFNQLYQKLIRSSRAAQGIDEHPTPQALVHWALATQIILPDGLESLRPRQGQSKEPLNTNRLHKTYELLVNIFYRHYGFDPSSMDPKQQKDLRKALAGDLKDYGFNLDRETLDGIVKDSAEYVREKEKNCFLIAKKKRGSTTAVESDRAEARDPAKS